MPCIPLLIHFLHRIILFLLQCLPLKHAHLPFRRLLESGRFRNGSEVIWGIRGDRSKQYAVSTFPFVGPSVLFASPPLALGRWRSFVLGVAANSNSPFALQVHQFNSKHVLDKQTDKQTNKQTNRQKIKPRTNKQTNRQSNQGRTNKQTNKHTDNQTKDFRRGIHPG